MDLLTSDQVNAIAEAMPPNWRIGVLLAAWCGLRSSEVRELRRKDVNTEAGTIMVERYLVGSEVRKPLTSAGVREVSIPSVLAHDLVEHLVTYVPDDPEALIISGEKGELVHDVRWGRAFQSAVDRVFAPQSKPRVPFHSLRQFALAYAYQAGATMRELQKFGGYSRA